MVGTAQLPDGITFNQATDVFFLCFNVIGEIGEVSPITFPNTVANPVFIENTNQEPGVNITNGSVTVASVGIALSSDAMEVKQLESFCVDIRVNSFQEIATMEYTHSWNPRVLTFDSIGSIQLEGLTSADIVATSDSTLKIIWTSPDLANGTIVGDGSVIYTLCFTPIGNLGDCSNFTLTNPQEVTSISSQGEDLGIFNNIKNICIDNFGIINSVVTPPSCDGGDGALRLDISGDDEDFVFLVQKDGEQFANGSTNDSIRLDNLSDVRILCSRISS